MNFKHLLCLVLTWAIIFTFATGQIMAQQTQKKIEIMLVGFDHLNQLYTNTPQSDVYSAKKQAELARLNEHLAAFAPDMIMVESDIKDQMKLDSLFSLYLSGKVKLSNLENGRGEIYQVGFALSKQLKHTKIYAVDHYQATSQSLLSKGDNIEYFQQELKKLQQTARPLKRSVQQDSLSLYDYIVLLNKPEMIQLTHRLFYNLPAVVVNGEFSQTGTNTAKLSNIDNQYIGAEFITLFYNRNLKIYSNILNTQMKTNGKRLLVIIGQTHIGVLQDLLDDNPNYTLISPLNYLKTN